MTLGIICNVFDCGVGLFSVSHVMVIKQACWTIFIPGRNLPKLSLPATTFDVPIHVVLLLGRFWSLAYVSVVLSKNGKIHVVAYLYGFLVSFSEDEQSRSAIFWPIYTKFGAN